MKIVRACVIAFSMYSAIPVPTLQWNKEDMEYVFCFFPLVGVVTGAFQLVWIFLARLFEMGNILIAAGCVVLPVLVTGGIHIDGFCDTTDALASNQSRERKLEILKDSNVGAFAVIGCICYFIFSFGVWHQAIAEDLNIFVPAVIFTLSRTLSSIAATTRKNARGSGMLATFSDVAAGRAVKAVLAVWLILCVAALVWLGMGTFVGFAILVAAMIVYLYYYRVSNREFGGITGDLAGWFLCLCEIACLFAAVLAQKITVVGVVVISHPIGW